MNTRLQKYKKYRNERLTKISDFQYRMTKKKGATHGHALIMHYEL